MARNADYAASRVAEVAASIPLLGLAAVLFVATGAAHTALFADTAASFAALCGADKTLVLLCLYVSPSFVICI